MLHPIPPSTLHGAIRFRRLLKGYQWRTLGDPRQALGLACETLQECRGDQEDQASVWRAEDDFGEVLQRYYGVQTSYWMRQGNQWCRPWKNPQINLETPPLRWEEKTISSVDSRGSLFWEIIVYSATQKYLRLRWSWLAWSLPSSEKDKSSWNQTADCYLWGIQLPERFQVWWSSSNKASLRKRRCLSASRSLLELQWGLRGRYLCCRIKRPSCQRSRRER